MPIPPHFFRRKPADRRPKQTPKAMQHGKSSEFTLRSLDDDTYRNELLALLKRIAVAVEKIVEHEKFKGL